MEKKIDVISVSASKDASGKVHITLVNIDPNKEQSIDADLRGIEVKNVSGQVLTSGKINDYNSFDTPDVVSVKAFKGAKLSKDKISITLPSKSVVMLELN